MDPFWGPLNTYRLLKNGSLIALTWSPSPTATLKDPVSAPVESKMLLAAL